MTRSWTHIDRDLHAQHFIIKNDTVNCEICPAEVRLRQYKFSIAAIFFFFALLFSLLLLHPIFPPYPLFLSLFFSFSFPHFRCLHSSSAQQSQSNVDSIYMRKKYRVLHRILYRIEYVWKCAFTQTCVTTCGRCMRHGKEFNLNYDRNWVPFIALYHVSCRPFFHSFPVEIPSKISSTEHEIIQIATVEANDVRYATRSTYIFQGLQVPRCCCYFSPLVRVPCTRVHKFRPFLLPLCRRIYGFIYGR